MNDLTLEHWLAILGIAVNVIGFTLIVLQVRQQARAIRGDTYTNLCSLNFEIQKFLAERPHLYKYFYALVDIEEGHEHWEEAQCCCQMIASYCENSLMQREGIPKQVGQTWLKTVQHQIITSSVLQDYLMKYKEWYSPELVQVVAEMRGNSAIRTTQ